MAVMVRPVTMTLGTSGRGKVINFLIKGDIMSTVRMARYLVHEIKDKFEENFNKAYPEKEIPTTVGDKLYQELIGNKLPKVKDVLEEQFGEQLTISDLFIKTSYIRIKAPVYLKERQWNSDKNEYEYLDELDEEHKILINLSNEKLFPRDPKGYRDDPVIIKMAGDENVHIQDVIKFVQYESKRVAKKEEDCQKVVKAVEQFTTLNQALKAWPALAKLCPPEKISKVHEKQQRKRKEAENRAKIEPIENEINQTILTASLLED